MLQSGNHSLVEPTQTEGPLRMPNLLGPNLQLQLDLAEVLRPALIQHFQAVFHPQGQPHQQTAALEQGAQGHNSRMLAGAEASEMRLSSEVALGVT
jgi:hypothetical protein